MNCELEFYDLYSSTISSSTRCITKESVSVMHNRYSLIYLITYTSYSVIISTAYQNINISSSERVIWDLRPDRNKRASTPKTRHNSRHGASYQSDDRQYRGFGYTYNPQRFICGLDIYIDHSFFSGTCHGSSRCVIDRVTRYVAIADRNFRRLDVDEDGLSDNIGFSIYRMVVNTESGGQDVFTNTTDAHALLFEMARHSYLTWPIGSCLSVLFIDRSLDNSIIGLAYSGRTKTTGHTFTNENHEVNLGGICQGNARILQYGVRRYSTLIVTSKRRGKHVSSATLALTLTHELGHSFGARHDPVGITKFFPFGSYVMHPTDVNSNMAYSQRFSEISIKHMSPIIHASKCLDEVKASCGNYVTEEPEECDCGESRFCLMVSYYSCI